MTSIINNRLSIIEYTIVNIPYPVRISAKAIGIIVKAKIRLTLIKMTAVMAAVFTESAPDAIGRIFLFGWPRSAALSRISLIR